MIELVPVGTDDVERIARGDLSGFPHAAGWPHADTLDGLGLAEQGALVWLVTDDGVVVGDCGSAGPAVGDVEIGFGLAAECRARGRGTVLVQLLCEQLLALPQVDRLVARTLPSNLASRRVLEKAGFAATGEHDGLIRYERERDVG